MTTGSGPDFTVAIVPREKFSYAEQTLAAVLEHTPPPFELIYVDGNSPPPIADAIRRTLRDRPRTRVLRYDRFLGPFQSRNIAIREAQSAAKYLVILDNDVLVRPGWLENLRRCAEQEGAGAVVPLVLIGGPDTEVIHHAGGDTGVSGEEEPELLHYQHLEHHHSGEVADRLQRQPTRLLEDHCIFAKTALWKSFGELEERTPLMTSVPEISMRFQRSGEKLLVEPSARVVYLWGADAPLRWSDLPTWYLAWSEKWSRSAMREMANRLELSKSRDQSRDVLWWLGNHRRVPLFPLLEANRRLFERAHLPLLGNVFRKLTEHAEGLAAFLIAEWVRSSKAGEGTGCPPLWARYPRLPRGSTVRRLRAQPFAQQTRAAAIDQD
jgi:GT2 family glycosyltransferase